MGAAAADYDTDGYADLYVTGVNRNHLFHNNGNGTFTDVMAKGGVAGIDPKYGKTWGHQRGLVRLRKPERRHRAAVDELNKRVPAHTMR